MKTSPATNTLNINPHVWEKFKRAERHILRLVKSQRPCGMGQGKRLWNKRLKNLGRWQKKLFLELSNSQ